MASREDEAAANRIARHINGKVPPPDISGAIPLDASLLRDRVLEILGARLKQPMPHAPTISVPIVIFHGGKVSTLDVGVVQEAYESSRWQIVGQLIALGKDPDHDGSFALEVDKAQIGSAPDGRPAVRVPLTWTPHALGGRRRRAGAAQARRWWWSRPWEWMGFEFCRPPRRGPLRRLAVGRDRDQTDAPPES